MKFKHGTAITFILLFWTLPEVKAAQELSAEKAQTLTSFKQITLNGRFNNLGEVAEACHGRQINSLHMLFMFRAFTVLIGVEIGESRQIFIIKTPLFL